MLTDAPDRYELEEQIEQADEVIAEHGDSADPVARSRLARAFRQKAGALFALARWEELAELWDDVAVRFHDDAPGDDTDIALEAIYRKAHVLSKTANKTSALQACDEAIASLERDSSDGLSWWVFRALNLRMYLFVNAGRYEEALVVGEGILRQLEADPDFGRWPPLAAVGVVARRDDVRQLSAGPP